jgi:YesN/AraC family two-component response regulator
MEKEKLFQEADLTLHELAGRLQSPTYQVSQALNEGMKKNFYDLVNGHRVEEAKRLLLDSKNRNYTILSVGFEAGFNSKTTFNTVFKKFTGMTPTEFRDTNTIHPVLT